MYRAVSTNAYSSNDEFVVLASYHAPEMNEYVQYVVVRFAIVCDEEGNASLSTQHSVTIPFYNNPSSLIQEPHIYATTDLAYISFDTNIIIVSLTPKSKYENFIQLSDRNDAVLYISVSEENTTEDNITHRRNKAYIFTELNGVLEVQINIDAILSNDPE